MPWGGGSIGHAALLSELSSCGTWGQGTAKPLTSDPAPLWEQGSPVMLNTFGNGTNVFWWKRTFWCVKCLRFSSECQFTLPNPSKPTWRGLKAAGGDMGENHYYWGTSGQQSCSQQSPPPPDPCPTVWSLIMNQKSYEVIFKGCPNTNTALSGWDRRGAEIMSDTGTD